MAKEIVINFEIDGVEKSIKNLSTLKSTISDLENQLDGMDLGTEAFEKQKSQIDSLKGKYAELSQSASEKSVEMAQRAQEAGDNFEKFAKGVVDAVSGVALVLGASEKDAAKFAQKFGTIVGVATGVKGAIEAANSGFTLLKNNFPGVIAGLQKIWAVMMANPILAIIGGVVALTAAIAAFISSNDDATKSLEEQTLAFEREQNILAQQAKYLQESQRLQTELAKARGASAQELIELQKKQNVENQNQLLAEEAANNKRIAEIQKIANEQQDIDEETGKKLNDELKQRLKDNADYVVKLQQINNNFTIYDAQLNAQRQKDQEEATKKEADELKKRQDAYQKFLQARLNAARQIRDLELQAIKDDDERELAEIQEKYKRIREDAVRNTQLTSDERKKIIDASNAAEIVAIDKHNADVLKKQQDAAEALKKQQEEDAAKALDIQNRNLKASADLGVFNAGKDLDAQLAAKQAQLDAEKQIELSNKELTELEKQAIEAKYAQQSLDLAKQTADQKKEIERQRVDAEFQIAQAGTQSLINLSDLFFAIKSANTKKGSDEELKAAKAQFKINKALSIVSATISGIQGVVNALSAQSVVPEPFGTVLKIANAVVVGTAAAANIAKIAATQFNEGGSGGGSAVSAGASAASAAASSAPSLNNTALFSTGQQQQTTITPGASSGTNAGAPQAPVVKAIVVESDITNSQKRVSSIQERASI